MTLKVIYAKGQAAPHAFCRTQQSPQHHTNTACPRACPHMMRTCARARAHARQGRTHLGLHAQQHRVGLLEELAHDVRSHPILLAIKQQPSKCPQRVGHIHRPKVVEPAGSMCVCVSVSARMYVCVRIQGRVCLSGVVPPTMSCTNGAQPCSPVERSARSEPVALQSP